jgi:hypothetical protein
MVEHMEMEVVARHGECVGDGGRRLYDGKGVIISKRVAMEAVGQEKGE